MFGVDSHCQINSFEAGFYYLTQSAFTLVAKLGDSGIVPPPTHVADRSSIASAIQAARA
jgi:hypothetical protein